MSLLGPSMHRLNQKHRGAMEEHLGDYARGMLAALEGLHRKGVSRGEAGEAEKGVAGGRLWVCMRTGLHGGLPCMRDWPAFHALPFIPAPLRLLPGCLPCPAFALGRSRPGSSSTMT